VKNLKGSIDCSPNTEEKYIRSSERIYANKNGKNKFKYKIRFIDSFKFVDRSLDKLVNNLEPNKFIHTRQTFGDDCKFLLRKGVFAYDWFDSFEKLSEKQLPPQEAFHSKLNGCDITNEDYEHAKKVWKHFRMKSFCEYHDLYHKTDVLLLASGHT